MQTQASAPVRVARRFWGMSLVRGIVLIIFGLIAIFWPNLTFRLFMFAFGIFAIVEGVILILNAFTQQSKRAPDETYARTQRTDYPRATGADYQQGMGTAYQPGASANYPQGAAPEATSHPHADEGNLFARGYEAAREEFSRGHEAGRERVTGGAAAYGGTERDVTGAHPQHAGLLHKKYKASRGTLIIEGVLSILCGIAALILPGAVGTLALYAVAAWALFKGFGALMQMKAHGVVLAIIGILGVLLFLFMIFNPFHIIRAVVLVVGVFCLIIGIMLFMRGLQHRSETSRRATPVEPSY